MIRAVVEYARDDTKPLPPILAKARRCMQWHCLPANGGEREQPAGILDKMTTAINIYDAVTDYEANGKKAGEMAKWRNDRIEYDRIIRRLRKAGLYNG